MLGIFVKKRDSLLEKSNDFDLFISHVFEEFYGRESVIIYKTKKGKPFISDNCFISKSHSLDYLVFAVSDVKISIDIEKINHLKKDYLLKYLNLDEESDDFAVFRNFTMKECFIKYFDDYNLVSMNKMYSLCFDNKKGEILESDNKLFTYSFLILNDYVLTVGTNQKEINLEDITFITQN
jgi:hypothetical protein